jgi:hypothetical protein
MLGTTGYYLIVYVFYSRLINELKPGSVKKINRVQSGSFKQFKDMENIENFLKAIAIYGVSTADKFGTPNLTDRNNGMTYVLNCIHAVGRAVRYFFFKYSQPWLYRPFVGDKKW